MKLVLPLLFLLLSSHGLCQDSYRVMINSELVVEKNLDDSIPVIYIDKNAPTVLRVGYKAKDYRNTQQMRRQFMLFTPADAEVAVHQLPANEGVAEVAINPAALASSKQQLLLYTISFPTDPELAKRVKLRRVLLAKIEWDK